MKNINIEKYLLSICLSGLLLACTDKFDEYNRDKTTISVVGKNEMAAMFSHSLSEGINWYTSDNGNRMRSGLIVINTGYATIPGVNDRYIQNFGHQNSGWEVMWKEAYVPTLKLINVTEPESVERGVAIVWKVWITHQLTDIWGPIPYDDAGDPFIAYPKYESQRTVYYKMFKELELAAQYLKKALEQDSSANAFGVGDMIWNGKVDTWYRFCNTLRLRLALRISNIEPAKAKVEGEAALVTGMLLENNSHDGIMDISTWNGDPNNGMCRINGWYQQIMTTSMESYMVGYADPRLSIYWRPVYFGDEGAKGDGTEGVNASFPVKYQASDWLGTYRGLPSGLPQTYVLNEVTRSHSRYGYRWNGGENQYTCGEHVVNAAETWFLKAEAAFKGWSHVGASVEECYKRGIEVSMKQWVEGITQMQIDTYINSGNLPSSVDNDFSILPGLEKLNGDPVNTIPVKLASDNITRYEQICLQKWLANFPLAAEAWAEIRRTRLPVLFDKLSSDNANISPAKGQIQTRAQFSSGEKEANMAQVVEAVKLLGKGSGLENDLENVPLWWDVHANGSVTPGTFTETGDIDWDPILLWER